MYSLNLKEPRGGTYAHSGHVFTFSSTYDFEGTFSAGFAEATNATADGVAVLIDAADYALPDLAAAPPAFAGYVLEVALPLAVERGASGLLVFAANLETSRSVGTTPGFFPPLDAYGVAVALETGTPLEAVRFAVVEVVPDGLRMAWTEVPGRTYAVEMAESADGTFRELASSLALPEFTDTGFDQHQAAYYRVRLE